MIFFFSIQNYLGKLNKEAVKCCVAGFITDGNSKLVGNARLRQLRVQRNSCHIVGSMLEFAPDCHAPYSLEVEDMGSYDPGWNHSARNITMSTSSPWMYRTEAQLRAHPVWGKTVLYRGGGFVAELGPDLQNASRYVGYICKLCIHQHWKRGACRDCSPLP